MIIDEQVVPLDSAGKYVPGPKQPSRSTLWRWALRGCRGRVLETARIGHQRITSREAIRRFLMESAEQGDQQIGPAVRHQQTVAALRVLDTKNL